MKIKKIVEKLVDKKIVVLYTEFGTWSPEDLDDSEKYLSEVVSGLNELGLSAVGEIANGSLEEKIKKYNPENTVIFNWCEGFEGDDYDYHTVPLILDKLGFAYSGNGPVSLRLATDKYVSKEIMMAKGISTPLSKLYHGGESNGWNIFPALVKPAREHCSYGITRESVVDNQEELHKRINELLKEYGGGVLVEDFIEGTEYNVALWGNSEKPDVLPIGVVDYSRFSDYHDKICGYDSKWVEESLAWKNTPVICPAPMSRLLKKRIEELAIKTFRAFECRGYTRVDIRVRGDIPYVLDVNPNPDITSAGGFARSAKAAGYSYAETIAVLLSLAADWRGLLSAVQPKEVRQTVDQASFALSF